MHDSERVERLREIQPEMAARSAAPSSAANGFAATCSAVKPPASTNKAARIGQKSPAPVLTTTSRQPQAISAERAEDHVDRAEAAGQPGRRKRQQAVGEEEDDLGEKRFGIVEVKGRAQGDDQRIIVRGDEAPGEEQAS